jgi:hypothetical protein
MYDNRIRLFKFERIKSLVLDFCKTLGLDPPEIILGGDANINLVTYNKIVLYMDSEHYQICAKKVFSEWLFTLCVYAEEKNNSALKNKILKILSEKLYLG